MTQYIRHRKRNADGTYEDLIPDIAQKAQGYTSDGDIATALGGKVTTTGTMTANHVVTSNGGTVIKDSGFTISKSVPSDAVFTDTTYSAGNGLSLSNGAFSLKTGYTTSGKNYKVQLDSNGNPYVNVPWTDSDTKVTAVGNHYTPAEEASAVLSADASSTTAASWNSTSLVTGVDLKRDAKGHVVGIAVDSIKMPANPNSDTKVRQSITTLNENHPLLIAYSKTGVTTTNVDNVAYRNDSIYANPSTGTVTATKFKGALEGNVTGNCSGSSGSCTGNAATATKLGTSTVGSATQPIYLNGGVPTAGVTVNNGLFTVQGSGVDVSSFDANSSTDVTLNIKGQGNISVKKTADNTITVSNSLQRIECFCNYEYETGGAGNSVRLRINAVNENGNTNSKWDGGSYKGTINTSYISDTYGCYVNGAYSYIVLRQSGYYSIYGCATCSPWSSSQRGITLEFYITDTTGQNPHRHLASYDNGSGGVQTVNLATIQYFEAGQNIYFMIHSDGRETIKSYQLTEIEVVKLG